MVLSGSTINELSFIVLEGVESLVRVGKYVAAIPLNGPLYIALVDQLRYYHEFYEEGDVWVEAIRKGMPIPGGVARQYLYAKARIVGVVESGEIRPAPRPPPPGTSVYTITGSDLAPIYGHDPSDPDLPDALLSIGTLYGYDEERLQALIDLRSLTMHLAVIGTTGSGKSNTMGVIIEELGKKEGVDVGITNLKRTVPVLIVDINGDYLDYYYNPDILPGYSYVDRIVFENSEAWSRRDTTGELRQRLYPLKIDLDVLEPDELAEALVVFYRRGLSESTALQETTLANLLDREKLEELLGESSYNTIFSSRELVRALKEEVGRDPQAHRATVSAVWRELDIFYNLVNKYQLLPPVEGQPFTEDYIKSLTDPENPILSIIDYSVAGSNAPLHVKQFILYVIAKMLFKSFVGYRFEGETRVLLFAIEEAQNFAPNLSQYQVGYSIARSILSTIATQGRKFGLSLAIISQRPRFVDPVVLNMMNTFIIHRVAPADISFVEQVSGGIPLGLKKNLATMEKGTAIVIGQMNPSTLPTVVKVRKRVKHGVGG